MSIVFILCTSLSLAGLLTTTNSDPLLLGMSKDKKVQVLEVIKKELLPKGRKGRHATAAYQVEDGE